MAVHNIFIKLLNGKTATLQSTDPIISLDTLKTQIQTLTQIPPIHQRLITGTQQINSETLITSINGGFPTIHLLLRLVGGKGGFGSLLRGAATKAGQKKTNNFDACRDMSGRRLRHVNAEKRLQEWKDEEPLRDLEKKAEEFIRKKMKMVKKKGSKDEEKYVEKYRKDSEKCMNDVEAAVRDSFARSQEAKRKLLPGSGSGSGSGLSNKRLKLWMTKNKGVKSASDDDEDSDSESDENDSSDEDEDMVDDDEKSVVIDHVDRSKDSEGTSGSASEVGASEGEATGGSSEEENVVVGCKEFEVGEASVVSEKMDSVANELAEPKLVIDEEKVNVEENVCLDVEVGVSKEATSQSSDSSSPETVERPESNDNVVEGSASVGVTSVETADNSHSEKPLDFGDYNTAAEMEVLGIERLKTELQVNGLKCGGTLQERAARLFLLKTTPLDKLPKKLFAKK